MLNIHCIHYYRENWIAAGEKRNSYIPSRPEEYFSRRGEWISWVSCLGVVVAAAREECKRDVVAIDQ
jgi:hypothetical protein